MKLKWLNLIPILGGPLVTPSIYFFFETFEKNGVSGVLRDVLVASGVSLVVTLFVYRIPFRKIKPSTPLCGLISFILLELIYLLPKIPEFGPGDRMWLPIALFSYAIHISPTVLGVCFGTANFLKPKSAVTVN
jgi:hypothetical protein